jgi:hypothetical protein
MVLIVVAHSVVLIAVGDRRPLAKVLIAVAALAGVSDTHRCVLVQVLLYR